MAQFTVNAQRFDPYKNFKFRVKWDGRYVAGISKVSALKRTTEVVEHREGGDPLDGAQVAGPHEVRADHARARRHPRHSSSRSWANKVWNFGAGLGAEVSLEGLPQGHHHRGLQRGRPARARLQGLPLLGVGVPGAARARRQRQRRRDPDASSSRTRAGSATTTSSSRASRRFSRAGRGGDAMRRGLSASALVGAWELRRGARPLDRALAAAAARRPPTATGADCRSASATGSCSRCGERRFGDRLAGLVDCPALRRGARARLSAADAGRRAPRRARPKSSRRAAARSRSGRSTAATSRGGRGADAEPRRCARAPRAAACRGRRRRCRRRCRGGGRRAARGARPAGRAALVARLRRPAARPGARPRCRRASSGSEVDAAARRLLARCTRSPLPSAGARRAILAMSDARRRAYLELRGADERLPRPARRPRRRPRGARHPAAPAFAVRGGRADRGARGCAEAAAATAAAPPPAAPPQMEARVRWRTRPRRPLDAKRRARRRPSRPAAGRHAAARSRAALPAPAHGAPQVAGDAPTLPPEGGQAPPSPERHLVVETRRTTEHRAAPIGRRAPGAADRDPAAADATAVAGAGPPCRGRAQSPRRSVANGCRSRPRSSSASDGSR